MKKIWMVSEYLIQEDGDVELDPNNEGWYTSKEKAIAAVYSYLRNDFKEEDIINRVRTISVDDYVSIITECGEDYGMFDCRYDIEPIELDKQFGE